MSDDKETRLTVFRLDRARLQLENAELRATYDTLLETSVAMSAAQEERLRTIRELQTENTAHKHRIEALTRENERLLRDREFGMNLFNERAHTVVELQEQNAELEAAGRELCCVLESWGVDEPPPESLWQVRNRLEALLADTSDTMMPSSSAEERLAVNQDVAGSTPASAASEPRSACCNAPVSSYTPRPRAGYVYAGPLNKCRDCGYPCELTPMTNKKEQYEP